MATFPNIQPTYQGYRKRSKSKAKITKLGDGYEHRVIFGLVPHSNPRIIDLVFNLERDEGLMVEGFLRSREMDLASFTYNPHQEDINHSNNVTFSQSGDTVTITKSKHGYALNDLVTIDFTAGAGTPPANGVYMIASVPSDDTFTAKTASGATATGTASVAFNGAGQFKCTGYTKEIPRDNRVIISASFEEVFEP